MSKAHAPPTLRLAISHHPPPAPPPNESASSKFPPCSAASHACMQMHTHLPKKAKRDQARRGERSHDPSGRLIYPPPPDAANTSSPRAASAELDLTLQKACLEDLHTNRHTTPGNAVPDWLPFHLHGFFAEVKLYSLREMAV